MYFFLIPLSGVFQLTGTSSTMMNSTDSGHCPPHEVPDIPYSCLPLLPSPWTLHQWNHWCPECSLHIPVVTTWLSPEDSFPCHLSSRQCFHPWPEYHRVRGWDRVLLAPHCFFLCIPVSPLKFQLWTSCRQIIPPPTTPYHCCCLVTKSCLTFCDTMDCSLPGSFAHGISQVRELEWVAISCSSRCSQTRDRTHISCIADGFFTTEPQEHLLVPGSFPSVLWWMFLLVYALIRHTTPFLTPINMNIHKNYPSKYAGFNDLSFSLSKISSFTLP